MIITYYIHSINCKWDSHIGTQKFHELQKFRTLTKRSNLG